MSSEKSRLLESGSSATAATRGKNVLRKIGGGVLDVLGVQRKQTVRIIVRHCGLVCDRTQLNV